MHMELPFHVCMNVMGGDHVSIFVQSMVAAIEPQRFPWKHNHRFVTVNKHLYCIAKQEVLSSVYCWGHLHFVSIYASVYPKIKWSSSGSGLDCGLDGRPS